MAVPVSNLMAIKDRLLELGVSSSTPGLAGEERQRELRRRLQIADEALNMTVLESLSMNEIRQRLTDLGEVLLER